MICGDMGSTLPHRVKRLAIDHPAADLPLYYAGWTVGAHHSADGSIKGGCPRCAHAFAREAIARMEPFDPTLN